MFSENESATRVLQICFRLHTLYGPGLFESVYEELVCYELQKAAIYFTMQQAIPLVHEAVKMEIGFRADNIVEHKVILELKSFEALAAVHHRHLLTYLKLTQLKPGL